MCRGEAYRDQGSVVSDAEYRLKGVPQTNIPVIRLLPSHPSPPHP